MLTIRRRSAGALLPTLAAVVLALAAAPVAHGAKTFQVVVLGDSFASGEGAPAVDGDYGADGAAIGNLRSDRPNANPLADWNGGSADIALTGDGASDARRCHRSPKATAPLAVRRLQDRFPDIAFTFRSFACSGARIEEGAFGSFEGAEPIDQNDRVPGQISQANSYLNALPAGHAKRIDALVMNIGGNNLGFSNLIERCENIGPSFPLNPCNPRSFGGLGNDDALRVFEQGQGTAESPDVIGLDDLPGFYRRLDRKIDRVSGTSGRLAVKPAKVYLTGPPNPLAGSNGCTTLTGANDYEKNLQASEIAWLQQDILPRMISAMRAAATADGNDWEFLDMSPHAPNGMCSGSNRMFNRNRDALRTQGATIFSDFNVAVSHGIAHPNRAGYAAMAPILADRLSPQVIDAFTPSAPPSAELAPLQTLAPRVQLRLPDPPEDFPSRPAVRQGITTLAGPLGEGIGTVEVPVTAPAGTDSISLEARRCGPLSPGAPPPQGCSAIHTVRGVLVGTPGVPTGVTAATHVAGVDVDWAKGSPASRTLRRFVVRAENLDDRVQLGFSFGADLRTALLPLEAGRWTVDVLECTDRGCGNPSSAADVESNGPVQIGDIRDFTDLQIQQPVGVFTTPAGRRVRAGGKFPLEISWATWSHWRDLSDVRLRLVGERGELGTIGIKMASGRVTVAGPDSRIRRGRIGRRGTLAARRFALRTARATIVGGGDRSRLVELELPLTLSKRLLPQRVDVDIAAAGRGKQQAFGPAGSFQVRRPYGG